MRRSFWDWFGFCVLLNIFGCVGAWAKHYGIQAWGYETKTYPTVPTGNTVQIAASLVQKYSVKQTNYKRIRGTDVPGHYLYFKHHTWTVDVASLMFLCNTDPLCKGNPFLYYLLLVCHH